MIENNQSGLFTDLWTLGVILYEMDTGMKMFRAKNNMQVFDKILKNDVYWPESMDSDIKDLIKKLTNYNPTERIGFNNFSDLINH